MKEPKQLMGKNAYKKFHKSLDEAKKSHKYGAFVELKPLSEYKECVLLLVGKGEAGVAIQDGDIVSVHKNSKKCKESVIDMLGQYAIKFGGEKLDCYGAHLANEYMKFGLLPVARCEFNEELMPEDWDLEKFGKPDVIAMLLPPILSNQKPPCKYEDLIDKIPYFDKTKYKQMIDFRNSLLEQYYEGHLNYEEVYNHITSGKLKGDE